MARPVAWGSDWWVGLVAMVGGIRNYFCSSRRTFSRHIRLQNYQTLVTAHSQFSREAHTISSSFRAKTWRFANAGGA